MEASLLALAKSIHLGLLQLSRRFLNVPNLIREVTALRWDLWINLIRQFQIKICDWDSRKFDLCSTFDLEVAFHMCRI